MATVNRRPAAEQDLEDLALYLGQRSPATAARFLNAAERTFEFVAAMPRLGSPFLLSNPQLQDLRHYPVKGFPHHWFFYLVRDDGIEVVRVLHSAQDVALILEKEP